MAGWQPKYTAEQKRAIVHARAVRGLSGVVIEGMAARGELTNLNGDALEAFDLKASSVYSMAREDEAKRRRAAESTLASSPAQSAVEEIRRRLVAALDHETMRLDEQRRRKPKEPMDAEQLRKCARALRELAAMPAPGQRGQQPGRQVNGERPAGEAPAKPNTMAGQIARSLSPGGFADAAQDDAPDHIQPGELTSDTASAADSSSPAAGSAQPVALDERAGTEDDAGSYAREQVAGLRATAIEQRP